MLNSDTEELMGDIELGLKEAKAGIYDRVYTPQAPRRVGRPPLAAPKASITLRLDADVLAALKASGKGWQTRVNDMIRKQVLAGGDSNKPA